MQMKQQKQAQPNKQIKNTEQQWGKNKMVGDHGGNCKANIYSFLFIAM